MSLHISALAINENFQNELEKLSDILGFELVLEEEIDFETASQSYLEEELIDVYFGELGTMVFCNEDLSVSESYKHPDLQILTFAHSETSMISYLNYTENTKSIRTILEFEGERSIDEGNSLPIEEEEEMDTAELIWAQFEEVFGESFWDIDPNAIVHRFQLIRKSENTKTRTSEQPKKEFDKFDFSALLSHEKLKTDYSQEELLELFNRMILFAQEQRIQIFHHPNNYDAGENILHANFYYLKQAIALHPTLETLLQERIPMNAYNAFVRMQKAQISSTENAKMMELIQALRPISLTDKTAHTDKSWWEFWK